jgi:hypothetical protein
VTRCHFVYHISRQIVGAPSVCSCQRLRVARLRFALFASPVPRPLSSPLNVRHLYAGIQPVLLSLSILLAFVQDHLLLYTHVFWVRLFKSYSLLTHVNTMFRISTRGSHMRIFGDSVGRIHIQTCFDVPPLQCFYPPHSILYSTPTGCIPLFTHEHLPEANYSEVFTRTQNTTYSQRVSQQTVGFDPRTVQPVGNRYTDYATRPVMVSTVL